MPLRGVWVDASQSSRAEINAIVKEEQRKYAQHFPYDCDAIRKRISQHLATKTQTQKAFLQQIGNINSNTYSMFMSRKGAREGELLNIYPACVKFFKKLDQVESSDDDDDAVEDSDEDDESMNEEEEEEEMDEKSVSVVIVPAVKSKAERDAEVQNTIAQMNALDGLERDDWGNIVMEKPPTCNTIRKKINTFLATSGWNQTQFLKQTGVNSNSFQRFMKFTKPWQGRDNNTYGSACELFYKYNLVNKKMKSKKK